MDVKISNLPPSAGASFVDLLPTVDMPGLVTQKLTHQQLWDLFRQGAQLLNGASITVDAANLRLNDNSGDVVANWGTRTVYDDTGDVTVDWGNRFLVDTTGENAVEWDDRFLIDADGTNSVEWDNRLLLDTGAVQSVDWVGRNLIDSSAGTMLNWSTPGSLVATQGRIQFGGTTSGFPALKLSSATLQARLADDSAFCNVSVLNVLANNAATLITSSVAMTDGAAASLGTLTNAPAAGNPALWCPVLINGTTRYIPMW